MHPERWFIAKFNPQREPDENGAQDQHQEDGARIAAVLALQIETTDRTAWHDSQQALKQPALPASRAPAGQGGGEGRG